MSTETEPRIAQGTLHDAGELTVIADGQRIHHRAALVVTFDNLTALQRAVHAGLCTYQPRQDLPECAAHLADNGGAR